MLIGEGEGVQASHLYVFAHNGCGTQCGRCSSKVWLQQMLLLRTGWWDCRLLLLLLSHTEWRGFSLLPQDGRLLQLLLLLLLWLRQGARWLLLQVLLLLRRCAAAQAASRTGCFCLRPVDVSW